MALSKAKQDLTDATLALLPAVDGSGWLAKAQSDARARVAGMGLPVGRDEYWRYTNPKAFTDVDPKFAGALADSDIFGDAGAMTLAFTDGQFQATDGAAPAGISVTRLADDGASDIHWAQDIYGVLETAGNDPVARPLSALNTAMATDGVMIHATGASDTPVRIKYSSQGGQANLHHVIKVDSGASVTLIEEGDVAARSNVVAEVLVADGGAFHHIRIQPANHDRDVNSAIYARLGTESVFKSFTLTADGAMTRNDCVIELLGDDAAAHVAGTCLGDGDFHHDDTVFITHDAVNCESRQVFKKVLRNGATGVFQGKILVKADAQKTDGYQISQSLLLDDDSQFLAKPELEIYADDVACSHGSTSGAIDEQALFYLRSRGVPKSRAIDLLTLSFLAEAIEEIDSDALADIVLTYLEATLDARRG